MALLATAYFWNLPETLPLAKLMSKPEEVSASLWRSLVQGGARAAKTSLAMVTGLDKFRQLIYTHHSADVHMPFGAAIALKYLQICKASPSIETFAMPYIDVPVVLHPSAATWRGLQCCWEDPFLGQYLVIWATVTLAVNGAWGLSTMYLQSFIGMEQANASICRAFWFLALLLGASCSGPLMRRGGVHVVHAAALLAMSGSVAYGVLSPCFASLVTQRVAPERQGQIFGMAIVAPRWQS
eukprot:Skav223672  [mRNA]  locus=scaffold2794:459351:465229:- [translate_table: standard]